MSIQNRTTARAHAASFGRFLTSVLLLTMWLGFLPRAAAQPFGKVAVVPVGSPEARGAFALADAVEAELGRHRVTVVSLHEARDRFTARSRPPLLASKSDLDVLAAQANEAVQHVAFGRTAAAQRSVQEVMLRAERALESLNRETGRARQILDACLALVRGALHEKKRELALDHAMRCRRLIPDLAPSEQAHPAAVVGVLAEADDLMRRMHTGRLRVSNQPESACSVYLNGRHLGTTPFLLDHAASGEYRVQVECAGERPGRVHVVQLGEQAVELLIDSRFDAAVQSEPRLALQYDTEAMLREQSGEHATSLGVALGVDDVVLVRSLGERVELVRTRVQQGRVIARAQATYRGKDGDERALNEAVSALVEGRNALPSDVTASAEPSLPPALVAAAAEPQPVISTVQSQPKPEPKVEPAAAAWQKPTAYALAATSGALFGVGLGLDAWAHKLRNRLVTNSETQSLDDSRRYDRASSARWIGVATAPLGVAAVALWAEPHWPLPWWSYALAAGGVGAASYGVFALASSDHCDLYGDTGCLRDKGTTARGAIVLSAALPLLSVPFVQLIKRVRGARDVGVQSATLPGGAHMTIHVRY